MMAEPATDKCHAVVRAVHRFASRHNLAGGVLVAVSGGIDSVALLASCREAGLSPLIVGHVNHGLRGEDSESDATFVRSLADGWGLPVHVEKVDTGAAAAGRNLEATARRIRYESLARAGKAAGVTTIATAHMADDQAETVLMRVLRGTGLRGLAGIPAMRRQEI